MRLSLESLRSIALSIPLAIAAPTVGCSSRAVDAVLGCESESCAGADAGGRGNGVSGAPATGGGTNGPSGSGVRPIHRYSFDGVGSDAVTDSIGDRHGALVGAQYGSDDTAGTVILAGRTSDEYVNLPNRLLAGLSDATFESWVIWQGGNPWQRVFDFGEDSSGLPGSREEQPRSYLFLAFKPQPRAVFKKPPAFTPEIIVEAGFAMPTELLTHLAVVVDERNQRFSLYVNGLEEDATDFPERLRDVYDANDWLGRSIYRGDASLGGRISEFRVYDRALTAEQVLQSYYHGPDALP